MGKVVDIDQELTFGSDSPQLLVQIKFLLCANLNIVLLHEFELVKFSFPNCAISVVKQLEVFCFWWLAF